MNETMKTKSKELIKKLIEAASKKDALKSSKLIKQLLQDKSKQKIAKKEKELAKKYFKESTDLKEDVLATCKEIKMTNSTKEVTFSDGSALSVNPKVANAIVRMYENFNRPETKEKYKNSLNKSLQEFMKIVNFVYEKGKEK